MEANKYHRIVIKVGSNVLSRKDGSPDLYRMQHLVEQIVNLKEEGKEIILISSGAVAFGRSTGWAPPEKDEVANRQVWSALGQVHMIRTYQKFFEEKNTACAQLLVTRDDFRSRRHYLNMRHCFTHLLARGIVPVVNENDTVSLTELMFTDNDELAGLVAAMTEADALIVLTSVAGVFTGDPGQEGNRLLEVIDAENFKSTSIQYKQKTNFGRGGMWTKVSLAQRTAKMGIHIHIADGTRDHILAGILSGEVRHTYFTPSRNIDGKKRWIAQSGYFTTANVTVNEGAARVLCSHEARSLLPVGVLEIDGQFRKGDVIRILNTEGEIIAMGRAEYGSEKALSVLGKNNQKPLVHYDYLYVL